MSLYLTLLTLAVKKRQPATKVKGNKFEMTGCLDLTGPKSVARTTLDGMTDVNKREVDKEINKTLKKKINKEVKDIKTEEKNT